MKIYQEFHLSFPGTLLFFSLSREQRVHDGKILKGSFNNWIDSFLNPTAKDSQNLPFLGFIHRCSSHCVPSQVENDEARVHREFEGGGGIRQWIRAHRPQWCSMGSGRRNHCVGTPSFFLHAIITSQIWTSSAASHVSYCPFVMFALIVFCLTEIYGHCSSDPDFQWWTPSQKRS